MPLRWSVVSVRAGWCDPGPGTPGSLRCRDGKVTMNTPWRSGRSVVS